MFCSFLADRMENYNQQGDLADIFRASGGGGGERSGSLLLSDDWQFPHDDNNITLNDFQSEPDHDDFGDPFSNFTHSTPPPPPLFNDHRHLSTTTATSFNPGFLAAGGGFIRPPAGSNNNNIFSRMLQISPNPNISPCELLPQATAVAAGLLKVAPTSASDVMICSKGGGGGGGLVENGAGVQISSPRNAGIKRRKSQAKKVVCIPAPTPANSRPSGEVVPSDLWAWRKYGQKPIKGSPYPRGYYRCSSSKGCSARKQVERSRTDPNMLVITYTSEHNHPWPTQRNALAGSTRVQPNKSGSGSKSSNPGSTQAHKAATNAKELEEEKENPNISSENPMFDSSLVKEENMDEQMDMDGCGSDVFGSDGFDLHSTYKPAFQDSGHCDDFFADLGEIEADTLSILFNQGFDQDRDNGNKCNMLDIFDWAGNNNSKQQ